MSSTSEWVFPSGTNEVIYAMMVIARLGGKTNKELKFKDVQRYYSDVQAKASATSEGKIVHKLNECAKKFELDGLRFANDIRGIKVSLSGIQDTDENRSILTNYLTEMTALSARLESGAPRLKAVTNPPPGAGQDACKLNSTDTSYGQRTN